MIKTKKIMLAIAMTVLIFSCGKISVYAQDERSIYKSNIEVNSYSKLTDELGKALAKGAIDVKINFNRDFLNKFYKFDLKRLYKLINEAGYKSNNDYYINEIQKYSYRVVGKEVDFKFIYLETIEETRQVEEEVKRIIKNIIKPNMSEEEKVKVIHDYIVTHVQYDINGLRNGNEAHTAYAALFTDKTGELHETVCQGYSLLFYKMATEAGLNARIITGKFCSKSANRKEQPHAWNLIKINGNWYQIDLTLDDPIMNPPDSNYIRYDYYNLSDDEMKKDHIYNNPEIFPKCNTLYKDAAINKFILEEIGRSEPNKTLITKGKEELINILKNLQKEKRAELLEDLKELQEDRRANVLEDIQNLSKERLKTLEKIDEYNESLFKRMKKIVNDYKNTQRQERFINKDENTYEKNKLINSILEIKSSESKEVLDAKKAIDKASKQGKIQFWGNVNKNYKTELEHNFKINFNKRVSSNNLKSKILIFNKNTGDKVDIDVGLTNGGKTVLINKKQQFKFNNQYVLFISDDLMDSKNNSNLNKVIIMEIDC